MVYIAENIFANIADVKLGGGGGGVKVHKSI